jgi:hypothetical protein
MVEKRLKDHPPRSGDLRIQSEGAHPGTPDAAHEMTDARIGPLFKFGFWLTVAALVAGVLVAILFFALKRREIAAELPLHPLANVSEIPPEPRLQTMSGVNAILEPQRPAEPFTDQGWAEHVDRSRAELSSYGWVDRELGLVRVPIERAIEITLERGLPTAEAPRAGAPSAPGRN